MIVGSRKVFDRLLVFGEGPTDAVMVNNADWLDNIRWVYMLRDVGRHCSSGRQIADHRMSAQRGSARLTTTRAQNIKGTNEGIEK